MRRMLFILYTLLVTNCALADTPLTPRYVQVVGAELGSLLSSFVNTYDCTDATNSSRRYKRKEFLRGVFVRWVRTNSPAEKAGIQCGDVIVEANGTAVLDARALQKIVHPLPLDSEVRLKLLRPASGPLDDDARILVTYGDPVEITIKTVTLDNVAELAKKRPVRTRELIDEDYGPLVNLLTATTFAEQTPGLIEYTCSFVHNGEQAVLPIESPLFFLLGITDATDLKRSEKRTINLRGNVEREGIPTLTNIPVFIARRIGTSDEEMNSFLSSVDRSTIGVIRGLDSPEKNWYSWKRTEIRCYLPEALSRKVAEKIYRFERAGIMQR